VDEFADCGEAGLDCVSEELACPAWFTGGDAGIAAWVPASGRGCAGNAPSREIVRRTPHATIRLRGRDRGAISISNKMLLALCPLAGKRDELSS